MSLSLVTELHQAAFAAHQAQTVYALVTMRPEAVAGRLPLDLRLVLDTSSSMTSPADEQGPETKIARLRAAAQAMIGGLTVGDRLTIVSFRHTAKTLFSETLAHPGDRARAEQVVANLGAAGGTSILAGLKAGLKEPILPDHVARVVLVTDGEGNDSEDADCARLAFDHRGVAGWLIYGIGVDYNDAFLDRLAQANGGQYVHLHDLAGAADLFAAEAAVMAEVALTGLVVTVEPVGASALVKADRVIPQLLAVSVPNPSYLSVDLGDVDRARGQKLLLQFSVPALPVGVHALARVRCGYHVPARKLLNQTTEALLELRMSADPSEWAAEDAVLRTVQLAGAGRLATLGLAEAASGHDASAARTLASAAGVYDALGVSGVGDHLRTLTSQLATHQAVDEGVKRTLTTMARQAWQVPDA